MPGEAGDGIDKTTAGNTPPVTSSDVVGDTLETSLPSVSSPPPLTESLTPRAALERLKARRELASTRETEHGTPASPSGPGKPSGGEGTTEAAATPPSAEAATAEVDEVDGLLGSTFEPEGSSEEATTQASEEDPFVFEVDGRQIPRSEAQKGYLRGQDFTVKTQGLAEVRKSFETEIQAASTDRHRYGTLLGEQLQALRANEPQMPGADLKVQDPVAYSDQVLEYMLHKEQVRDREVKIGQLVSEQREADRKLFELKKAEETAKMLEAVPSLKGAKSDDQRGKLLTRFKQTAMDAGFAEGELSRLIDHRVIRILEWATVGRAVQNGTIKGKKAPAATRANGSNGSSPPLLPTSSLKATGGGGSAPELKTKEVRQVQAANDAFVKGGGSVRDGVALMRTIRHVRSG